MYPYQVIFGMNLYDICLTISVVFTLFMADRMGILRGFSVKLQKVFIFSIIGAIAIGFVGAIFSQAIYDAIETGQFVINVNTGMTFYGGLIFGVLGFLGVWFIAGKKMCQNDEPVQKFGAVADIAACLIPMAHGIGRIGCFFAGCCHGQSTDAWYGILMCVGKDANGNYLPFQRFVPVQLFEALFLFALSISLMWLFFEKFGKENKGRFPLLPIYIVAYGVWRFFIEYFRADDRGATIVPFLSPSQLVAILMVVLGVAYFLLWYFYRRNVPQTQLETASTGGEIEVAEEVAQGLEIAAENIEEKIEENSEDKGQV